MGILALQHLQELLNTTTADTRVSQVRYRCPLCGAVCIIHQDNVVSRRPTNCFQCGKGLVPFNTERYTDL